MKEVDDHDWLQIDDRATELAMEDKRTDGALEDFFRNHRGNSQAAHALIVVLTRIYSRCEDAALQEFKEPEEEGLDGDNCECDPHEQGGIGA